MTPDLKRLCEAAEASVDQAIIDADWGRDIDVEAIVRAVLTELREMGRGLESAARSVRQRGDDGGWEREDPAIELAAMIDEVLGQPATA